MDMHQSDAVSLPSPIKGPLAQRGMPDLHDTKQLAQWVALVAEVMMLAVCLRYLMIGAYLPAFISAVPVGLIIVDQIAFLKSRSLPLAPHVILLVIAVAQLSVANLMTSSTLIWTFPTLVGSFLIARTGVVNLYAAIMLTCGTAIIYIEGDLSFALRFAPAFAGTWGFLLILVQVMNGLRFRAWQQSITDPLTGCYNRRYLDQYLDVHIKTGRVAMLVIDMDNFKQLNDAKGHVAGDKALCRLVEIVHSSWASEAICFRLGGDEFVLLLQLPARSREHMSLREQDRHLTQLGQKITDVLNQETSFSVSSGLTHFNWPCDLEAVYRRADTALYASKDLGRRQMSVADTLASPPEHTVSVPARVQEALF
ncbi:putative diguanylate cyclase YcdT [Aliiroseovarius sp. xm-m-379]|uniref:GGDEF domain-containing protein n=2 Tax=unclassified Aliiroseovarius TaxID=2623558 RepID=UPI001569CF2B|nr:MULTISPECIES: GGDEF domain-containing protein [unclassified Aliiroseovarius]NRP25135.1 putative diguanylate cyclase YcdT [Aliiroseovarius sp. xm-m-379]NRP50888.1 putative diguanylate cyclase YcdT [Aliiroseovarius sp. xm-m-354]NRP62600.1 putative diguanylate cyclase YcdT [Aliiroseovarius sp. xm-a-151]NRQ26441.1 putative diguanylate cyclase YcdT [Aliiroseovarius sp. xm-g-7]NRP11912.1 putative diguanylate cyclase YcdT [Aliiroseovarius sp. xm-d-517]